MMLLAGYTGVTQSVFQLLAPPWLHFSILTVELIVGTLLLISTLTTMISHVTL
jgi:hypothetical protein